jgi:glycosyltransferase involved in cell wall biosynthesis
VIVTQLGARRHYLVPSVLHAHGMLARFYTDLFVSNQTRWITTSLSRVTRKSSLQRVASRSSDNLPRALIRSFPLFGVQYKLYGNWCRKRGASTRAWIWGGRKFAAKCAREPWTGAQAVFAYSSAALETFQIAKQRGLFCILDHATAPRRAEMDLAAAVHEHYPAWGKSPPIDPWIDEYTERQRQEALLADVILCGSSFVRTMIEDAWGLGAKCKIIPLGITPINAASQHDSVENRPLRVLFVGDEAMRKGLPDLISALKNLPEGEFETRVAGNLDLTEFGMLEASKMAKMLGSVPRQDMTKQYEWADVLVLPSTSDTFGLVVLEALAHGVPVIASTHTGASDAIADGECGFVIPPLRPDIIAEKLAYLNCNRQTLARFAAYASQRAKAFSSDNYGAQLIQVLKQSFSGKAG